MYILVGWGEIEHCGGRWIYGLWCQVWAGWSKMIHIVLDGWRKKVLLSRRQQSRLLLSLSSYYLCSTFDKRVPSSWYQFTHVWSISVTEDERNFFHYGWHQWHPGKYVLDEQEFLLIQNVNQFLSEDQSKASAIYMSLWCSGGHRSRLIELDHRVVLLFSGDGISIRHQNADN